MMSSPSGDVRRGNTPSSRPSRQTTRWGTERIGIRVHIVRWPVRKLARVGRPRSRSASSAADVGETERRRRPRPSAGRRFDDVVRGCRSSSARCHSSRSRRVGQVVGHRRRAHPPTPARASSPDSSRRCGRAGRGARRGGRRGRCRRESTSSNGSTPSTSVGSSSVIVTPSSRRSSPARHVPGATVRSRYGARCAASRPHRTPLVGYPVLECGRGRRRRDGSAGAPDPGWRSRATSDAAIRPPASAEQLATTPTAPGWSGARERSASRTRRSGYADVTGSPASSSSVAARPNVAWISGANVSMSGHITMMSRGSSVGSSASTWRIASRRTSTWRARPWQECTWMLRSAGSSRGRLSRPSGLVAPVGSPIGADVGLDAPQQRVAARRRSAGVHRRLDRLLRGRAASRGRHVPRRQERVTDHLGRAVVGSGTDTMGLGECRRRNSLPQDGRGMKEEEMHLPAGAERVEDFEMRRRQAGEAEQRQPAGEVDQLPASMRRPRAGIDRSARPGSARRDARRRRRHNSACHCRSRRERLPVPVGVVAGGPRPHHRRAVHAVAVEQVGEVANRRESPAAFACDEMGVGRGEMGGERRQPWRRRGTRRRRRATARRIVRGATGRRRDRCR